MPPSDILNKAPYVFPIVGGRRVEVSVPRQFALAEFLIYVFGFAAIDAKHRGTRHPPH
jgi:hypothetical protein